MYKFYLVREVEKITKESKMKSKVTYTNGILGLREFLANNSNYVSHGTLLEQSNGTFTLSILKDRPCYGELRRYKSKSSRPHDPHPGDLPSPLPAGKPVAVAIPLDITRHTPVLDELVKKTILHPNGPYSALLKLDHEILPLHNGVGCGILIKTGNLDSTLLVSLAKNAQSMALNVLKTNVLKRNLEKVGEIHPALLFFLCTHNAHLDYELISPLPASKETVWLSKFDSYSNSPTWSFRKVVTGDYNPLSDGLFSEGKDYNRPYLHYLFTDRFSKEDFPYVYDGTDKSTQTLKGDVFNKVNGWEGDRLELKEKSFAVVMSKILWDVLGEDMCNYDAVFEHHKEIENEMYDRC